MNVLILGGDGYLGWATAMHFSAKGHHVLIIDNYLKRLLADEINEQSLTPIKSLAWRCETWKRETGYSIDYTVGDLTEYTVLEKAFKSFNPDVVVHYGEQPSGPWSMISRNNADLTITNNLITTLNLAYAVYQYNPECHIIKLGTLGEAGTPDTDIPEGWLEYEYKGRKDTRLFPREAGSLYHTTKIMDTDMLWFYVRAWKLKVTDLMQGPVYGLSTNEIDIHEDLCTSFHHGECFGTALNRFLVQAAIGYPLTVYGKGGQTRGYLNIKDTLSCIELAATHPPERGKLEIYNQITEMFTVNDLAYRVQKIGKQFNLDVKIDHLPNPRVEKETHYYNAEHTKFMDLGLQPHYLTDDVLSQMQEKVIKLCAEEEVNEKVIFKGYKWRSHG